MYKFLLLAFVFINTAAATDYIGRLAAEEKKGGDSSLVGPDSNVSATDTLPEGVSAPDTILAGEASEDRSPSPDDPAPQPFDPTTVVHEITAIGGTGSCTYLGDGLFISCAHIFSDEKGNPLGAGPIKIDGKQYGGSRHALYDVDLSYIQLRGIPADWPAAKAVITELRDGAQLLVHGKMSGAHKATIDRSRDFHTGEIWATLPENTEVIPGDSGGGVFNEEGCLLGVIVGDDAEGDHVFFVPLHQEKNRFPVHRNIERKVAPQPPEEPMAQIEGIEFLLFGAAWCGPCTTVKQTILPKIEAAGYTVNYVDTDKEHARSVEYDILAIPTWVILKDGKEIGREVGGSVNSLLQKVK